MSSVTPSQQDLKTTEIPTGQVVEGETVSFKCSALRVKPPPRQMYWQFMDDASRIHGTYRIDKNFDKLTSSVSVEFTFVVDRKSNGKKLICHYITEAGNVIQSEEATVEVLFSGQPLNSVIVVLGTLLALSVAINLVLTICRCLPRKSSYRRVLVKDNKMPRHKDSAKGVTRDQVLAMVDAAAYEEIDDGSGIKGRDGTLEQNLKGATEDGDIYKKGSNDDVAHYEEMDAVNAGRSIRNHNQFYENREVDVVPSDYEEPRGDAPTYLELH